MKELKCKRCEHQFCSDDEHPYCNACGCEILEEVEDDGE